MSELEEAINNIRGAVMIVYPMGLPDYDHVRQILEEREILEGAEGLEVLEEDKTALWVFSKEMQRALDVKLMLVRAQAAALSWARERVCV